MCEANVRLARLNLSYCAIIATCDGVTGRKDIHVGQLVQPGQTMVEIVDSKEMWVQANYRESQIANIHVGSKVKMKVDAVPGVEYEGVVESLSDATGSAFSLMPSDNATGNFVKVEQRLYWFVIGIHCVVLLILTTCIHHFRFILNSATL